MCCIQLSLFVCYVSTMSDNLLLMKRGNYLWDPRISGWKNWITAIFYERWTIISAPPPGPTNKATLLYEWSVNATLNRAVRRICIVPTRTSFPRTSDWPLHVRLNAPALLFWAERLDRLAMLVWELRSLHLAERVLQNFRSLVFSPADCLLHGAESFLRS